MQSQLVGRLAYSLASGVFAHGAGDVLQREAGCSPIPFNAQVEDSRKRDLNRQKSTRTHHVTRHALDIVDEMPVGLDDHGFRWDRTEYAPGAPHRPPDALPVSARTVAETWRSKTPLTAIEPQLATATARLRSTYIAPVRRRSTAFKTGWKSPPISRSIGR